jgi:tetratricopeptide (TPR) repeat protein
MDRILRVVSWAVAAAAFGLAAPFGRAMPVDEDGRAIAQAAMPPEAPSAPLSAETSPSPLLAPPSNWPDRSGGTAGSSGGTAGPSSSAGDAGNAENTVGQANRAVPRLKCDEPPTPVPVEMAPPLKIVAADGERSAQLEQIAAQADRQTRHGLELAGRGAYFAARLEFLGALRLVAEGLDTEQKTDAHGRALTAALTAMKEADDFLPGGSRLEADADLLRIFAAHTTPVLKHEAAHVTSMTALKGYFTFAQEQFAAATGHEVAGSMALHALGKLHDAMAHKKSGPLPAAEPKAMVYFQAAMLAYPKNFMAANDLGVLLARCGNYSGARTMLEHSLSLSPQSATWHNLAVVYGQLGQPSLARQADQQAAALQQAEIARRRTSQGTASSSVQWVDPQTFAQTSNGASNAAEPIGGQAANPSAAPRRLPSTSASAKPAQPPSAAERMSWGLPGYQR